MICFLPVYALLSMLSRFHEHVLNRPVLGVLFLEQPI